MENLLFLATVYLLSAVVIVPLAVRLGLGSVLGYLAAGILIGPVLQLAGTEAKDLQHVAEFGVVLMLFLIGLELEPRILWDMRHRLLGLGGMQVVLTTITVTWLASWLGLPWQTGLAVGMMLSLSSTAIVLQTLNEKKLMRSAGGRSAFAVLLTQDIAVVPMLALIPLLAIGDLSAFGTAEIYGITRDLTATATDAAGHGAEGVDGHATTLVTFVEGLPRWGVTLLTLAIVAAIVLGGHYLTHPVFRFIHSSRLREMSTFSAL
ncbi:MAG: cation:proton antiporter, partial [Paracoccaceae bacterium]